MMHSFPSSASVLLLSTVVLLSSFSTNTSPLANALTITRARSPVSNDVVADPRAINARDPFDSNGNQRRDGIFGPGPEPDRDVAVIIPREMIPRPSTLQSGKARKNPDDNKPNGDTSNKDNDAPKVEDPPKPHHPGGHGKKSPKPGGPKKCDDDENSQNGEPCPLENGDPTAEVHTASPTTADHSSLSFRRND